MILQLSVPLVPHVGDVSASDNAVAAAVHVATSVMIDLPPTSTLEETHGRVTDVARALEKIPEIVSCQAYVGTAGPITFQGVARHYMLRQQAYQAELQIQLAPSGDRSRTSHEIAAEVRRLFPQGVDLLVNNAGINNTGVPNVAPVRMPRHAAAM